MTTEIKKQNGAVALEELNQEKKRTALRYAEFFDSVFHDSVRYDSQHLESNILKLDNESAVCLYKRLVEIDTLSIIQTYCFNYLKYCTCNEENRCGYLYPVVYAKDVACGIHYSLRGIMGLFEHRPNITLLMKRTAVKDVLSSFAAKSDGIEFLAELSRAVSCEKEDDKTYFGLEGDVDQILRGVLFDDEMNREHNATSVQSGETENETADCDTREERIKQRMAEYPNLTLKDAEDSVDIEMLAEKEAEFHQMVQSVMDSLSDAPETLRDIIALAETKLEQLGESIEG